jgi:hypothetical protein
MMSEFSTVVINHASSKWLLSCEMIASELEKLHSTIFCYCNEIISIIHAAFSFPDSKKEAQELNNEITEALAPTFLILESNFSVIRGQHSIVKKLTLNQRFFSTK